MKLTDKKYLYLQPKINLREPDMKENNKAILYTIIAVLSWSTVATAFKITLRHFTYFEMLLVASISALIVFAINLSVQKKWKDMKKMSSGQWRRLAFIGVLNPVAYYLVLFKSYDLLPAQIAQPINYSWPIVLLVLLAFFARQPIPQIKYIGMLCSLGGVALISLGTGGISGQHLSLSGLSLAFLSAFLWGGYWMLNNRSREIDSSITLFVSFLFGSAYLIIAAPWMQTNLASLPGVLSAVYVGIFEMGIPFVFFGLAIRKTNNPALVNQLCYLSPFLSLFLISTILGEKIYFTTYCGLFLIVFGIAFNEYLAKIFRK